MRMKDVIKYSVLALCCGMMALSVAACGDESSSNCEERVENFPRRATGTLSLTVEGDPIPVPVVVSTTPDAQDACRLSMLVTQNTNPLCGTAFSGTLDYDADENGWVGLLDEYDQKSDSLEKDGVRMQVVYTPREDGRVSVWNKMVESTETLCKDRTITGEIQP